MHRFACLLILLAIAGGAHAAPLRHVATFRAPSPNGGDRFGTAVALDGTRVIVGTPGENTGRGAAYVYALPGGGSLKRLAKQTPVAGEAFGTSVAIVNGDPVAGVPLDADYPGGAAYRYRANDLTLRSVLQQELLLDAGARLGAAVLALGPDAVAGAPLAGAGTAAGAGVAFTFQPSGTRTGILLIGTAGERLGSSLAALGNEILAGAPAVDQPMRPGAVYRFLADGGPRAVYPREDVVLAPDDRFGFSVAGLGGNVVAGAPGTDDLDVGTPNSGAVYLIDGTTRGVLWTTRNPVPATNDEFGRVVAASPDGVLVGAPFSGQHGRVHVLDPGTGALRPGDELGFPDLGPATGEEFGYAIAVFGRSVLVGAPDAGTPAGGAAYLFTPCGDGVVDAGEACDDGNASDADCCDTLCRHTAIPCSTTTSTTAPPPSTTTSTTLPQCGDGVVGTGETCDLGATVNGSAASCCTASCTLRAASEVCGTAAGPCQTPPSCSGTSPLCPTEPVFLPGGSECTAATDCLEAARCSGSSADCPAAAPRAAETTCTDDAEVCTTDRCDGSGVCEHVPSCEGTAVIEPTQPPKKAPPVVAITCRAPRDAGSGKVTCEAAAYASSDDVSPAAVRPAGGATDESRFTVPVTKRVDVKFRGERRVLKLRLNSCGRALIAARGGSLPVLIVVRMVDRQGREGRLSSVQSLLQRLRSGRPRRDPSTAGCVGVSR